MTLCGKGKAASIAKVLLGLAAILAVILLPASYVYYHIYMVEDLVVEISDGQYRGFSIGDTKLTSHSILLELLRDEHSNNSYEIVLGKGKANLSIEGEADRKVIDGYNQNLFTDYDLWVIYICDTKCDWRRERHWMSLLFSQDVLIRIAEFEKRKWEAP